MAQGGNRQDFFSWYVPLEANVGVQVPITMRLQGQIKVKSYPATKGWLVEVIIPFSESEGP